MRKWVGLRRRRGATAVGYGLLVGLIAVGMIGAVAATGTELDALLRNAEVALRGGESCAAGTTGDGFAYDDLGHGESAIVERSPSQLAPPANATGAVDTATATCSDGTVALGQPQAVATGCSGGFTLTGGACTNAPPTAADGSISVAEGASYSFSAGDFGFADADPSDALSAVRILSQPSRGQLTLANGDPVPDPLPAADIGQLTYQAPGFVDGGADDVLSFAVLDRSGQESAPAQLTVVILNDNPDPPSLSGLPSTIVLTEDTPAGLPLQGTAIADSDSAGFPLALTFTASSGLLQAAGGTGVTVAGSGTSAVTLTGLQADLNAVLGAADAIGYSPAADLSGTAADSLTVTGDDSASGGASGIALGTVAIDLTPVNDPPVLALSTATGTAPEGTSVLTALATVAVTDDDLGTNTLALAGADAAAFVLDGTALQLRAGVELDAETQPELTVTVTVDDTAVGATPDAQAVFTLTVLDVNEPPTVPASIADIAGLARNVAMAAPVTISGFGDPDSGATLSFAKGGTWPAGLDLTRIDNASVTVSGTPTSAAGTYANLTVIASDGMTQVASASFSIQVVNTAPTYAGGAVSVPAATAGSSISAVDVAGFADANGDELTFTAQGSWPPGLSVVKQSNTTARIQGTPTTAGTYSNLSIRASDGTATVDTASFTVSVSAAPPGLVGSSTQQLTGSGYLYASIPGLQPGDVLIAAVTYEDYTSGVNVANFTRIGQYATNPSSVQVYRRTVTASEPSSYGFDLMAEGGTVSLVAFRGASNVTLGTWSYSGSYATTTTAPSINIANAPGILLAIAGGEGANTFQAPSGMTLIGTAATNSSNDTVIGTAYRAVSGTGPSGNLVFNHNSLSGSAGIQVYLH